MSCICFKSKALWHFCGQDPSCVNSWVIYGLLSKANSRKRAVGEQLHSSAAAATLCEQHTVNNTGVGRSLSAMQPPRCSCRPSQVCCPLEASTRLHAAVLNVVFIKTVARDLTLSSNGGLFHMEITPNAKVKLVFVLRLVPTPAEPVIVRGHNWSGV